MTNNMGNMTKDEAMEFHNAVVKDLGLNLPLEFTPTSPSINLGSKVLISHRGLDQYKWQVKELILHEITHSLAPNDKQHGEDFYKQYVLLVSKYLAVEKKPFSVGCGGDS